MKCTERVKTKRRTCFVLAGMLAILSFLVSSFGTPSRPNVIFILMDDMGYSDVSCYGAHRAIPAL